MNIKLIMIVASICCFVIAALGIQSNRLTNAGLALFVGSTIVS